MVQVKIFTDSPGINLDLDERVNEFLLAYHYELVNFQYVTVGVVSNDSIVISYKIKESE